jgi:hypothetical protein
MAEQHGFRETYEYVTKEHQTHGHCDDEVRVVARDFMLEGWRLDGVAYHHLRLYSANSGKVAPRVSATMQFSRLSSLPAWLEQVKEEVA